MTESDKAANGMQHDAGPPPWIWYWFIMFALMGLPAVWRQWQEAQEQATKVLELKQLGLELSVASVYLGWFAEALPTLVLAVALAAAVLSRLRGFLFERRFELTAGESSPLLPPEVKELLAANAPRLPVNANWRRVNLLAYIYPRGIGRAGLALFGGFIRLWHRDRVSGEALLLHEIAHYKRGDSQVIGLADFLKHVVWFGLASFALFIGTTVLQMMDQHERARAQEQEAERQQQEFNRDMQVMREQLGESAAFGDMPTPRSAGRPSLSGKILKLYLTGMVCLVGMYCFQLLVAVTLPIAAVWTAELHADRFVVQQQGRADRVEGALSHLPVTRGWWRRLLNHFLHPPVRLRRWLLRQSPTASLGLILSVFPLAFFVRMLFRHGQATFVYVNPGMDKGWDQIFQSYVANTRQFFTGTAPEWIVVSCFFMAWPFLCPYWERLFSGSSQVRPTARYAVYLLAALLTAGVGIVGFVLRHTETVAAP